MSNSIDKVKEFIDNNFMNIDSQRHGLELLFFMSESKLEKDFKQAYHIMPKKYIKLKKLELAKELRESNQRLTNFEVMDKIGWMGSERRYREAIKEYLRKEQPHNVIGNFWLKKMIFDEILMRFVLFAKVGHYTKISLNNASIEVNVQETILQFTQLYIDNKFHFNLYYNLETHSIKTSLVIERIGSTNDCYVPNDAQPYLYLIKNIYLHTKGKVNFDIRKAIKNGIEMVGEDDLNFSPYFGTSPKHPLSNKYEIDETSDFITTTNLILESIKKEFKNEILNAIDRSFNLNYSDLVTFKKLVESNDYDSIIEFISNSIEKNLDDKGIYTVDLLLRICEFPDFDHLDFESYNLEYPKNIIQSLISNIKTGTLGQIVVTFRKTINQLNDDSNMQGTDLLRKIIERF